MGKRAWIADDELRELYHQEQLTIAQTAARFGVAPTTIRRRFADLGLSARPRGPVSRTPSCTEEWSAELAYAGGLMATDGCLARDGRTLSITSKDLDLLETLQRCLRLRASNHRTANGRGVLYHRLQWKSRSFYAWFTSIGLMPAKSLRLGSLQIPDEWFRDFLRGCIDGDGSISTYVDRYHSDKNQQYVYIRLYVSVVSASPPFLEWLRATAFRLRGVAGSLAVSRTGRNDLWRLRYAKGESLALLRWMYYAPTVPCLGRKRDTAAAFLAPATRPPLRRRGRPVVI
jgi:hypothetical protein